MISNLDLGIIAVYFLIVFAIGFYVARQTKTDSDLFLGGRNFSWGLVGLSLFASNISSSTIIGLTGSAYAFGIVNSVYEWGTAIPMILFAVFLVPLYLSSKITTIPEFLERRFDRRSRVVFSFITIVISLLVDTAGGLYAGSIVLQVFFPSLVLWQTCFVLALIAGIYTAFGGLKAVVYTDALQAIILIVGGITLTYVLFSKVDFSWATMLASVPEGHFSVIRPIGDETMPWTGHLLAIPLITFWYWATNQYVTQRVLGARDVNHARWGLALASLLKFLPLFIMVIPGVLMISVMPGIENADSVFPQAVINFLPVGLVGLVLAGLISAIMSSVDSTLNSASTLVVHDFIKPRNPEISSKKMILYGRTATFVFMIVAASWAPLIENFSGLWGYLQSMFAIIVPPVVVIMFVGIFYKRGNGHGAFWTLVVGLFAGLTLFLAGLGDSPIWDAHYTYNVVICAVISTAVFVGVSLMTPEPDKQQVELYTYRKSHTSMGTEGLPLWKDYRLHCVILACLIVVHYWVLW